MFFNLCEAATTKIRSAASPLSLGTVISACALRFFVHGKDELVITFVQNGLPDLDKIKKIEIRNRLPIWRFKKSECFTVGSVVI